MKLKRVGRAAEIRSREEQEKLRLQHKRQSEQLRLEHKRECEKLRAQYKEEHDEWSAAVAEWERAMERWNRLYYCSRCDGVFIPGEGILTPVEELEEALYPWRSAVVS